MSAIFGPLLVGAAIVLTIWEAWTYRHRGEDGWLVTPRRLRRRMLLSAILAVIGTIIHLEASGVIVTAGRPGVLLAYVTGLGGLSTCLVILAMMDIHDTVTLAARRSMEDLEQSFTRRSGPTSSSMMPPTDPSDDGTP